MIIYLKTRNGSTVTLEVEGTDTYEEVVSKINNELDSKDPLITENPRIIINGKELLPGKICRDIGVHKDSEGHIVERISSDGYNIRKPGGWIQNLKNTERFKLYNQLSRKQEYVANRSRREMNTDLDLVRGGGRRKKRKSRRTRRKGSKRKGSKRRRKSRRTRMR